jgi:hypothetical protein
MLTAHQGKRTHSHGMQSGKRLLDGSFDALVAWPEHRRVAVAYQPVGENHPARTHRRIGFELVSQVPNQRPRQDDLRLPEPELRFHEDPPGMLGCIEHLPERRGDLVSVGGFEEPGAAGHQLPALLGPLSREQTVVETVCPDFR